ncbi:MAG: polyprenyl synthetase family protein, partial [Candidatus Eisenbacteria sp.]|nr:polyprenyl synthetase family protein [Candidatus Eisenbacteria bacterium]
DDLPAMDDDDTRRGRPTCHKAFDEATAILAGDALLTLAFEIVAREERLTPERRLSVMAELAAANGPAGMVGGQLADMEGEGAAVTLEAVEFIHLNKTARPLKAAALVGALAAGVPPDGLLALGVFGERIGLAFQIADDLLDVTGTEQKIGKAVGKDQGRGKLTYPAAVGVSRAAARARELTEEALAALDVFGGRAWALREIARFVVVRRN